jgi:hypothetical protein
MPIRDTVTGRRSLGEESIGCDTVVDERLKRRKEMERGAQLNTGCPAHAKEQRDTTSLLQRYEFSVAHQLFHELVASPQPLLSFFLAVAAVPKPACSTLPEASPFQTLPCSTLTSSRLTTELTAPDTSSD